MKRKKQKQELYRVFNASVNVGPVEISKAKFYYFCRKYQNDENYTWFRELRESVNSIEHYFEFCEK